MVGVSTNNVAHQRIGIDTKRCSGHGRCYTLAPHIFDMDDEGFAVLREEAVPGDSHLLADAQTAVDACPERAISMETDA